MNASTRSMGFKERSDFTFANASSGNSQRQVGQLTTNCFNRYPVNIRKTNAAAVPVRLFPSTNGWFMTM